MATLKPEDIATRFFTCCDADVSSSSMFQRCSPFRVDIMTTPNGFLYSKDNNYMHNADSEGIYCDGTLALMLRMSRCAGVAPLLGGRAGGAWRFRVSPPLAVLQTSAMTVYNLIVLICVVIELYQEPEQQIHAGGKTVQTFVWVVDTLLMQVIASLAIYKGPAQMENLRRVLQLLRQIKFDLSIGGPSAKQEKIRSIALVSMLLLMVSCSLTGFITYLMQVKSTTDIMWTMQLLFSVRHYSDFLGMLAMSQWACSVLAVHDCAAALNERLQRLQQESDFMTLPRNVSVQRAETLIQRLALAHVRISDIIRQMSETHGQFLIVLLLSTFFRIVITLYYMMFLKQVFGITFTLNWTVVHLAVLIITTEPCHWTHAQREYTAILLSELIVQQGAEPQRLSTDLDQLVKQLALCNTRFSALGVYTLDRQLTAAVLSGCTTYLIIIVQLQTSTTD